MGKNNSYAEAEGGKGQGKQPVKKTRYLIVGVAVALLALVAGIVLKSRPGGGERGNG